MIDLIYRLIRVAAGASLKMFPPVFGVQSFATLSAGKCCYPDGRIPIVELRSSKKIERNLLTDSVIYDTLFNDDRFGYSGR
ncbi:hypothetical protein ACEVJK_13750 [Flintibacter sp. P01028]|uniref:hypothetical protein n=1 Tax=Flintibacter sp. P01028 TaxID=3342382 RepID=UPI0035B5722A|nr:hypothetical protein [Bacteroidales bacterium]